MSTLPPQAAAAAPSGAGAAALQLVRAADGNVRVHGPLTFATARRALALGRELLGASAHAVEIDCSGVTAGDSAGLAVLLEWLGLAKQAGRQLHYTHLPQDLTALAGISELQELLARGV
ncbi:MAG TPA: STAS domain-containing protein [Steroidobacteraceae bacterium]|jgi:phospholipid transport system transporter-binding protein|nr:STAS domain-containing protein [Steroidobacteraceae bacterium]